MAALLKFSMIEAVFKPLLASLICFNLAFGQQVMRQPGQIALTPPMGWSSWNIFKKEPSEKVIMETTDALIKSGLKSAGYQYVNIDDFWSNGRDEHGKIMVDTAKFPHGMKFLADYIHSKGLKAGIYTNIGTKANYATLSSGGYYDEDMKTFAGWGYDYVKVDVNFASVRTEDAYKKEFTEVSEAVKHAGRTMLLSICNQGGRNYWNWAPALGNSWRVGADIDHAPKAKTQWEGMIYELDLSAAHPEIAGPGHWNDADMMLIGVGSDGGRLTVMTQEEQIAHFTMWCMIASPLIIGNNLRNVSKQTVDILTNKEAIAVNQDALGIQAKMIAEPIPGVQIWIKQLKSNSRKKYAVTLFNRNDKPEEVTLNFSKAGLAESIAIRDLWTHKNLGNHIGDYTAKVMGHAVQMLVVQ